jgi:hypothetical protein
MATNALSFPVGEELLAAPAVQGTGHDVPDWLRATARNRNRIPVSDKATAIALIINNQIRENTMTTLIALYFMLPVVFISAVTVRDVIFGDVV